MFVNEPDAAGGRQTRKQVQSSKPCVQLKSFVGLNYSEITGYVARTFQHCEASRLGVIIMSLPPVFSYRVYILYLGLHELGFCSSFIYLQLKSAVNCF